MNNIKLNQTPIRTSKNFNINDIKLENINIPDQISNFENVTIIGEDTQIEDNTGSIEFVYGLGDTLETQVKTGANNKIKLTIDSKQNKQTQIEFKFDEENINLIQNTQIIVNKNSKATIILKYETEENIPAFHNGIISVLAKENSNIDIIIVNLLNTKSNNFMAIQNKLEENAKINYTIIDFGGKNSITNYYSDLLGKNSQNNINTIYLGKENQLFDLNYIAHLKGKQTNINIEVQGALKDKAKKHFKGTIDFKKGSTKAIGNENENCMLLSDTARSIALPMLLCSEEDVKGNHSSSASKIGKKELFYIMSRGISKKHAEKLMVKAKFNKILENIEKEELKEQILREIDERLN